MFFEKYWIFLQNLDMLRIFLFQTEEGKQSEWVELLHTQDAKERAEFVEQIENALIEKSGNPG